MTDVKICGITSEEALNAAIKAGAAFVGFVFHEASPRHIDPETAKTLTNITPTTIKNVGLFVNPKPRDIAKVLESADLDMIQLHGDENIQDVQTIRGEFGLPVIKAVRVGGKEDLAAVPSLEKACDWLLFDAKSPKAQGGTGESFDWSILADMHFLKPWMLAGGLNSANVQEALSILSPRAVDVSSGVEDAPGVKNPEKIKEFIAAVHRNG